jgi:hypothetical protein
VRLGQRASLSASIDGVPIPNTALDDSRVVERLLLKGATVAATVVPAESTPKIAPIVRVADAQQSEIVLLAQDGDRFIFGVRTGASVIRVRRPFFALADVFPLGFSGDSSAYEALTLTARYAASGVRIRSHSSSTGFGRVIPINASLGWTLWLPLQWLIEGTRGERVISLIWMACLAIPLGQWAIRTHESSSPTARSELAIALLMGAGLLFAGFAVIPYLFGLSVASFMDWVATLGGLLLGYSLGGGMARSRLLGAARFSVVDP